SSPGSPVLIATPSLAFRTRPTVHTARDPIVSTAACDLVRALVRNIQYRATRLAMHRVAIMALKTADRARESYLGRSQQRLGEIQKKSHAEDHYNDRYANYRSWQGDVAETCRGQRRDC